MPDESSSKQSDDWLKALSVCALVCQGVPAGRETSAGVAALFIVALSNYSRAIFQLLYLLATGFLIWLACVSREPVLVGYAILYAVLGVVLIAEGERRRVDKGNFLSAFWWGGQALIHGLDVRHAQASGESSGFFTDIFLLISAVVMLKEIGLGIRGWLRRRGDRANAIGVITVSRQTST